MPFAPVGLETTDIDQLVPVQVGPGCRRRDLPSRDGVRIWVVDMAPGAVWPQVDQHGVQGEDVFIVAGEMIEGETRHGPGTYLKFGPHSAHRPWTETGVQLFGFNLL